MLNVKLNVKAQALMVKNELLALDPKPLLVKFDQFRCDALEVIKDQYLLTSLAEYFHTLPEVQGLQFRG